MFDNFIVDLRYRKSCYTKYAINPIEKSEKNHNMKGGKSKGLTDEALEKFHRKLSIGIIRNKEAFSLNHILGYLK